MSSREKYVDKLKTRAKDSRVYKKYQLFGLEIAQTLKDEKHTGLYIKLCKAHAPEHLLSLAKDIAANNRIKRKGAYFMACVTKQTHGRKNRNNGR